QVLGLPRGGVPVAYEVAKAIHAPLDVFIVRKIGVPGHQELAMGAIAMGDVTVFNESIIRNLAITQDEIQLVIEKEKKELARRDLAYRGNHVFPILKNKTIILVDDGIATGASLRAAIVALRKLNPSTLIVGVPVAEKSICAEMELLVEHFVCPLRPTSLDAVGMWYDDFSQTEDEDVYRLLKDARLKI
ncbi:MAG: phosphoribosyltransferase, partial [Gammaproteobacteria bacterium]|nr:phosphoribosyltransferase [Gammaproteobacteria bacterium]